MKLAPIVLFVYNRPEHTKKTLEYLQQNYLANESRLFIFADGAKDEEDQIKVNQVRDIICNVKGFSWVEIFRSDKNKGLANSVIDGVSLVLKAFDSVIVLEDDLLTAPDFLQFMNDSLKFYKEDKRIWSIGSYNPIKVNTPHSIYLSLRGSSTGWATWKDRWERVNWNIKEPSVIFLQDLEMGGNDLVPMLIDCINGDIDSWAVRWNYTQCSWAMYSIVPVHSKIYNIGYDNTATNSFQNVVQEELKVHPYTLARIEPNEQILKQFKAYYDHSFFKRIRLRIFRRLGIYKIIKKLLK